MNGGTVVVDASTLVAAVASTGSLGDRARAPVAENGQRLGRIEGFLGIGIPDPPPE